MGFLDTVKGLFGGRKGPAEAPITGEAPAAPSAIQEKLKALVHETEGFAGRIHDVMAQPGAPVEATPVAAAPAAPVEIAPAPTTTPLAGVLAETTATAPVATPELTAPVPMATVNASLGAPAVMPMPANEVKMPEAPTVQEHEGQQAA